MTSVTGLLSRKVLLPPIQGLARDMPHVVIDSQEGSSVSPQFFADLLDGNSSTDYSRSLPYTISDDLSIFKVILRYFGDGFRGKIPWSFWQTYRKMSKSNRSNSSLYHHWNGAMKKKYEAFIASGRIADCVAWLETAVASECNIPSCTQVSDHHTGYPLMHSLSQPPGPVVPVLKTAEPLTLVRNASGYGYPQLLFYSR